MCSAWRSEVRQWVWCTAVWVAVACEMRGLASTGVWPDGREVADRTLRSTEQFSNFTESSNSWIQLVPNKQCMPVPPNTLRIRLSSTLSAASPTVQDRPHPCMANGERGAHAQRCQRRHPPHALRKCPAQRRAVHPPAHAAAAELHPRPCPQPALPTLPNGHGTASCACAPLHVRTQPRWAFG